MKPKRIQRKRTKDWRLPPNTVCVTRPGKFGNPFKVGETWTEIDGTKHVIDSPETAVEEFKNYMAAMLRKDPHYVDALRGKTIACWCEVGAACHGDVLLELANVVSPEAGA